MNESLASAFTQLRSIFGTHVSAAKNLNFSPQYYRALRNGRLPIPQRTAEYILLKVNEFSKNVPNKHETQDA